MIAVEGSCPAAWRERSAIVRARVESIKVFASDSSSLLDAAASPCRSEPLAPFSSLESALDATATGTVVEAAVEDDVGAAVDAAWC